MYALPNQVSSSVKEVTPWEVVPNVPAEMMSTKDTFSAWAASPSTRHCFYSGATGQVPTLRISDTNPVVSLSAVVADYDARISNEMLTDLFTNYPGEWMPTYVHRTNFSGGVRLVWVFSKPVLMAGNRFTTSFLRMFAKKLMLRKLLPNLDEDALYKPQTYYDIGRGWTKLSDDPVPYEHLHLWAFEAGNAFKWKTMSRSLALPIDEVAKEVERRWPGRWTGNFLEGARGVRFWDPTADCPTAAVIRATGVQCFTGDRGFVPWVDILGPTFLEKFNAGRIGAAVEHFWYDSKNYWRKTEIGTWAYYGKEDLKMILRVEFGLSAKTEQDTSSEIEKVICEIMKLKTVACALPVPHRAEGEFVLNRRRFLNIAQIHSMAPAEDGSGDWGVEFPWLAEYLDNFFVESIQLEVFLAWWRRFWLGGLRLSPEKGQALFIAGDVGTGKTLLSTAIIGPSVGGSRDASAFLMGETQFARQILANPLMTVDDESPAADRRKHVKYTANVKKLVANREFDSNEKHQQAAETTWSGRLVVTCNMDPDSMRLIPDLDMSILDKVIILRCSNAPRNFKSTEAEMVDVIQRELPYLLKWLAAWEPPAHVAPPGSRFGVLSYKDPLLYGMAVEETECYVFLGLLRMFLLQVKRSLLAIGTKDITHWTGSVEKLLLDMRMDETVGQLARDYKLNKVGSMLAQLRSKGFGLDYARTATDRTWVIPFAIVNSSPDPVAAQAVKEMRKDLREEGELV